MNFSTNYNNRKFRILRESGDTRLPQDTVFHLKQNLDIVTCIYFSNSAIFGRVIGKVKHNGAIEITYIQSDGNGGYLRRRGLSFPVITSSGKLRLHESWRWETGDLSFGETILEEL